jgi:hypothetical protein
VQDKKNEKDFGKTCREEVKRYEVNAAKDYRLNFRLKKACEEDIKATCKDTCSIQEGEVGRGGGAGAGRRRCCGRGLPLLRGCRGAAGGQGGRARRWLAVCQVTACRGVPLRVMSAGALLQSAADARSAPVPCAARFAPARCCTA